MDGLSGFKIYNQLHVSTRFLPRNYGDTLDFIITGVTNDVKSNDWTTSIETMVVPVTQDTNGVEKNITELSEGVLDYKSSADGSGAGGAASCEILIVEGFDTPPEYEGKPISPPKIYSSLYINGDINRDIIPILESTEYKRKYTKGHRMLALSYIIKEGYKKGSASYITKNPGNIGNTDNGKRNKQPNLKKGMELLMEYFSSRANGTSPGWEFGPKTIPQYYSKEIANNPRNYQRPSGCLPGYKGNYQGQLGYFTKRYATFARVNNNGISGIATIFSLNGYSPKINGNTLLKDLLAYNPGGKIKTS